MTTAYWRDYWGNPDRRGRVYGYKSSVYSQGKGYHRGQDIKPLGNLQVPALRAGTVADVGFFKQTGWHVAIAVGGGRFDIYCHMYRASLPSKGDHFSAGEIVGRLAQSGESPGSAWTGPHLHFVVSNHRYGAISNHADYDPRPIISNVLANPSDQEDPDMPTFFRHIDTRTRTLTAGAWNTVNLSNEGGASFASGKCMVQSTTVVRLQGLAPGTEILFRQVRTQAGTETVRDGTTVREAVATGGNTSATMTDSYRLSASDDGLRWQYRVDVSGVTVDRTEVAGLLFKE